jgi:hypothetical protein
LLVAKAKSRHWGPDIGEVIMRVLFGILLGVALTVSVAFIADTWTTGPTSGPTTTGSASGTAVHRNMVNWDVVGEQMHGARVRLHEAWNKISERVTH